MRDKGQNLIRLYIPEGDDDAEGDYYRKITIIPTVLCRILEHAGTGMAIKIYQSRES